MQRPQGNPRRLARAAIVAAAAIVVVASAAGCAKKGGGPGAGGGGGFQMPPMPVETATVERRAVADRFESVGTLDAGEAVTIVSEIEGRIVSLPFREGEAIRKGAVVAQIDDVELRAAAERASAWRNQTQVSYDRVRTIVSKNAGSPQALDDAEAAFKMAEADLALAASRLEKARITAPFDGIAGIRRVSPGAYVRPGDVITDLVQTHQLKVTFSAPERYLGKLTRGTPITVATPAFPGDTLSGQIDVVDATVDPITRSVRVLARVPNTQGKMRPGMSASVSALLSQRDDALTVQDEAVFAEGDRFYVFLVNPADSSVARRAITLGTRLPGSVEVLDGLEAGARVVRAGHQKLFDGAKVIPIDSAAMAAGAR